MIDDNKLKIHLDDLINNIREEVANNRSKSLESQISYDAETSRMINIISHIENILKTIESKAYLKHKLSDRLNRFPFNWTPKIERFILKVINYLFKEQREININLILILKESIELNRQLVEQMTILKAQINHSETNSIQCIHNRNEQVNTIHNNIEIAKATREYY